MEGSALHLENRTQVIVWLRENYKHATTTSVSKRSVFAHYLEACKRQSVATPISHTYFGKLVRKAFPDVRCNRKGPRGSAQQHYRLIRADGGDADEFLSAHFGDELEAEAAAEEEYRAKRAKRSSSSNKKKTTAAALRKNGVSATAGRVRVRAAATAAASTISRMISADQAPANLTEAWSFSSAPSSPSFSATASVPSSPGAQAYAESDEDDDHDEEEYTEELIEEEYFEEEQQEPEQELEEDEDGGDDEDDAYESDDASSTGANANEEVEFNFDLPQFEITPGEESPGTSFSYEAGHSISGHEQNLRLQQQLQQSLPASTQAQAQFAIPQPPQQQQSMSYFEPSAFYDFVSPDLEMPLSAINQVNLAEDFGWSVPSMPSAVVDNCASAYHHQQAHYYQQQHQQQPVHSYLLADQLPATQCSDLAEWVAHYCN